MGKYDYFVKLMNDYDKAEKQELKFEDLEDIVSDMDIEDIKLEDLKEEDGEQEHTVPQQER
jgi:hypothetical protein